jgi:hypothetical protein
MAISDSPTIYKILLRRLLSKTAHLYCVDIEIYFGGEAAGQAAASIPIRLPLMALNVGCRNATIW